MFDPSPFANPTPLAHADTSRDVLPRGGTSQVVLKDVWYVPKCWLKVNNNEVFYGSRSVNGSLFKTNFEPIFSKERIVHTFVVDSSLLQLYHERWGHQYKRRIRNMLEKELGIRIKLAKELYEPCIYVKAHRLSFGTREKASEPDELISADVCGSFDESFQEKK
ncbi:retrovirus-related Pol polyprotein from transposon TNT 1-94 [Trichonephila clavipes]|nr:retrovirus-related Pol polyprotein from transposon TNT 1-94 [Trichonephila clavipes]